MEVESRRKAESYALQAIHYFDNARKELLKGELEKASELLWGSIAEAFKALAMARRGLEIKSHSEFWDLARSAAKELGDESIYTVFREANSLHSNFYEAKLERADVEISFERVRGLLEKLVKLASEAQ